VTLSVLVNRQAIFVSGILFTYFGGKVAEGCSANCTGFFFITKDTMKLSNAMQTLNAQFYRFLCIS